MIVLQVIGSGFLFIGVFFVFVGMLGVLRMPDVYNKLQAGTKATTLGFLSVVIGVAFIHPTWALKLILIAGFILLTNPIGSHAIARAARNAGVDMVKKDGKENKEDAE